jgi:hypothetical protein
LSAFNILVATTECPNCRTQQEFEIQFKYGNTWQLRYTLGEFLTWGGNDIGSRAARRVLVEGVGGPCPNCHALYLEFDLVVERNRISDVRPIGTERPFPSDLGYVEETL